MSAGRSLGATEQRPTRSTDHARFGPLLLLSVVSLLAGPDSGDAQTRPLWHELSEGLHDVGFERVWEVDPYRVWPRSPAIDSLRGPIGRPIRVDVWYPAGSCGPSGRMPLRDYVETDPPPSPAFEDLAFLTRRWDDYSYRGLAEDSTTFDRLMATETAACAGAVRARGHFPLVVYSAGWFNRAPDNTILAEYLASHGFVVATVPQANPGLWTFNFSSDAHSVENQVRDLEVAIAVLARDSLVDRRRIAAMGYSTGGDVALLLQGRNPLVDAVVGLDASWTLGPGNDVMESSLFESDRHRVPILAARRPVDDRAAADELLGALVAAPRLVIEIPRGDHGSFSDDPAQRLLLGTDTGADAAGHAQVVRVVLAFLQEVLQKDAAEFDGAGLARRLGGEGLMARFYAADPNGFDD